MDLFIEHQARVGCRCSWNLSNISLRPHHPLYKRSNLFERDASDLAVKPSGAFGGQAT